MIINNSNLSYKTNVLKDRIEYLNSYNFNKINILIINFTNLKINYLCVLLKIINITRKLP